MTIKPWIDRLEEMDNGHITTNADVQGVMLTEIDELRAEVKELRKENLRLREEWSNSVARESELRTKLAVLNVQPVKQVIEAPDMQAAASWNHFYNR